MEFYFFHEPYSKYSFFDVSSITFRLDIFKAELSFKALLSDFVMTTFKAIVQENVSVKLKKTQTNCSLFDDADAANLVWKPVVFISKNCEIINQFDKFQNKLYKNDCIF